MRESGYIECMKAVVTLLMHSRTSTSTGTCDGILILKRVLKMRINMMQEHKNFSYLCVPTPIYFNYIIELLRVTLA